MTTTKQANRVRDKALAACADPEAARAAWQRICDEYLDTPSTTLMNARLAMLEALAAGKSLEDAEKVAREALSS